MLVPHGRDPQGKIDRAMFGLCFAADGGTMTIGGPVDDFHTQPVTWLPLHTSRNGWYLVKVKSIKLGESMVSGRPAGRTHERMATHGVEDSGLSIFFDPYGVWPAGW